jgi:hypothetical protein
MFGSNFLLKALMKKQLAHVPKEQQDFLINLIEKNPEFFMKIAQEAQEKIKGGMPQQDAMMAVMKAHEEEIKRLLGK